MITHVQITSQDAQFTDHLQGWGTVAAVLVALVVAVVGWLRDNRLRREEQTEANDRLRERLDEQRARDEREFLIEQLQRVGEAYAAYMAAGASTQAHFEKERARQNLCLYLPVLPPTYASLIKMEFQIAFESPAGKESVRRKQARGEGAHAGQSNPDMAFQELADNIAELLGSPIDSHVDSQLGGTQRDG